MFSQKDDVFMTSWRGDARERDWFTSVTAAERQSMSALTNNNMLFIRIGFAHISVVFHNCKLNGY